MRFSRVSHFCDLRNMSFMDVIDGKWIAERLTGRRGEKAELARHMGVGPDIITKILSGDRRVQPEEAPKAVSFFSGADASVLDDKHGGEPTLVAVYDIQASAGDGAYAVDEYQVGSLAFPKNYLRSLTRANLPDLAIISVKGDSMLPTLADDDVVMLDTSKRDLSYDGLFVIRDNGNALLVKRIGRASKPGCVTIISDNRDLYSSVEKALSDIEVIGKVIWAGGKM